MRRVAAQCIGAVAAIDVAQTPDQWPELLPAFLQVVQSPEVSEQSKVGDNSNAELLPTTLHRDDLCSVNELSLYKQESTLEACGYMCEELESGALSDEQTNQVRAEYLKKDM